MPRSVSLSLSRKLPILIASLCIAASVSIAVVGYLDFRAKVTEDTRLSYQVLTESRGQALSDWFAELEQDVASFGRDPAVVGAATAFSSSYSLLIDGPGLQEAYVTNNPNPPGERDKLDQAPDAIPYHFQHAQFHPHLRQKAQVAGYEDLFLFNPSGDLLYSVEKGADFATNFLTGPFADSGLARGFSAALQGSEGAVYFADFAPYAPGNTAAAFLATQVVGEEGSVIGVAAVQVPSRQIDAIFNNPLGLGETGQVYVVGPDLLTRSSSRLDTAAGVLTDVSAIEHIAAMLAGGSLFAENSPGLSGNPVMSKADVIDVFGRPWAVVGEIDLAEAERPIVEIRNKMTGVTLLVAVIGAVLGWMTARSVVQPLARLGDAMENVSEKTYAVDLSEQSRGDEIGNLFKRLDSFRDKLQTSDRLEEERQALQDSQVQVVDRLSTALSQLAEGNLTHQIDTRFDGEYDKLRLDYNRTMDNLNDTIGSVVIRSAAIRQRSDSMSKSSDDLSRRTENQAATLEQTAAALDEMTASVKSAAEGARKVKDVVISARHDATESEPVVKDAVQAMTEIESSSQEISQIIGVIDDIAFQTNLLALNAGVEAARAGDAGRGFAVVASEVRALAQRSSDAAKQIKSLISASSDQVGRGVRLVGEAGEVLTRIANHINHISDLVAEISSGSQEQSIGIGEINIGVTQLDKVTQQNAAMVEEATASSHALNTEAAALEKLMHQFRLDETKISAPPVADNIADFVPKPATEGEAPAHLTMHAPRHGGTTGGAAVAENIWEDF